MTEPNKTQRNTAAFTGTPEEMRQAYAYYNPRQAALDEARALLTAAANAHTSLVVPDTADLQQLKCRPLENYVDYGGYRALLQFPGKQPFLPSAPGPADSRYP